MKQEFEMQQEEMDKIISINKANSNTVMMIGGVDFSNNLTEAINAYWRLLADKYGFIWNTVEGSARGKLFFLAQPKRNYLNHNVTDCLKMIVKQLKICNYENEAGDAINLNIAFIALEEMANNL